jgi:hypothetical protein
MRCVMVARKECINGEEGGFYSAAKANRLMQELSLKFVSDTTLVTEQQANCATVAEDVIDRKCIDSVRQ